MYPEIGIELDDVTSLYMEILTSQNLIQEKIKPWARQHVQYIAEAGRRQNISFSVETLTSDNEQVLVEQWIDQMPAEALRLWISHQADLMAMNFPGA